MVKFFQIIYCKEGISMLIKKPPKISAYEALIKYNITSLPVPISYTNGIKIFSMQFLAEYHKQNVSEYFKTFGYRGFVCYEPHYENYVIFINENDPESVQRWSISIAIGYIENYKFKNKYAFSISEASLYLDSFCFTYTCPDCILQRDNLLSADQIIETCKIPFYKAREKSKRLKLVSNSINKTLNKLESMVCELISSTYNDQTNHEKQDIL